MGVTRCPHTTHKEGTPKGSYYRGPMAALRSLGGTIWRICRTRHTVSNRVMNRVEQGEMSFTYFLSVAFDYWRPYCCVGIFWVGNVLLFFLRCLPTRLSRRAISVR